MRFAPWLALLALAVGVIALPATAHDPNALWRIVHDRCVPAAKTGDGPAPCTCVDTRDGYALLKDLVGPLQYLLLPTVRVSGIESPQLLEPGGPHYLADAWQDRDVMATRFGRPIADDDIMLALNSPHGRTQNQLHVHISCIAPGVKQSLANMADTIGPDWAPLPQRLAGHRYLARHVTLAELQRTGAARLLARHDDARAHMGDYGLALTQVSGAGLVLLATHVHRLAGNFASPEELESHACHVLPGIAGFHAPAVKQASQ